MTDLDRYKYKAEGTLDGKEFTHEGEVYAPHSWDAAEQAEEEVRALFPGVILKGDEPERGVTSSPQVFVTRDIVNRAVEQGARDNRGNLVPTPIPDILRVRPKPETTITPIPPSGNC